MRAINKQLKILSETEISALYEIPDFDYEQRLEHLTLTDKELQLALGYKNLSDKVHCILQIGYFKAVKMFYRIGWNEVNPDDYLFIMQQYFQDQAVEQNIINKYQYYSQCSAISELFEYRLYDKSDEPLLCLF